MSCHFLNTDDEFWIDKGESGKLCLVQIHDKQLVGRCHLGGFTCKLTIKVAHIFTAFLKFKVDRNLTM